jgi:hypothetical protein
MHTFKPYSLKLPNKTEKNNAGMFFWWTSSEFVILVPIQNSTWLLESVVQFDWLRFKTLFFKNYTVV